MKYKDILADYNPNIIETKWQAIWRKEGTYEPDMDNPQKPFYNLMMFPYPSAEGMHIGNMYAFTGADIYGRFKRMQGFDVFEPIGLDGFGIHSENYALKIGEHPKKVAARTQVNFYKQLQASGNGYSWRHTLETYDPKYYKWTQWLFIQMFKHGLAYKAPAPVNFCPSCKTVLADEQVIAKLSKDGQVKSAVCERCDSQVEIKKLNQWFFKITAYAPRLLENLQKINWPSKVLLGQKNWIGQSYGAEIIFKVEGKDMPLHVFTTRLDTIYGATALVIAPDKTEKGDTPLALEIASEEQKPKVASYLKQIQKFQVKIRGLEEDDLLEKTGVFTGAYALNPFSGERIPIWVANYVVGWYGTGVLMVVPAHDKRDFEFAKKYKIPIRPVIKVKNYAKALILARSIKRDVSHDLRKLKIKTTISKKGHYLVELTSTQIDSFINLISKSLKPDYWVEIVGEKTVFIFGTGEIIEIKNIEDEEKVFAKCKKIEKSIHSAFDLWDMLTDVSWYQDIITTTNYGVLINSSYYSGLTSQEAIPKMIQYLKDTNQGGEKIQYRLRDWIISRQRYWGAPIPMIYCETCAKRGESWFTSKEAAQFKTSLKIENPELFKGWYPVPENQLPVLLPEVSDWKPKGTGVSPLASVDEFVYVDCPYCGEPAKRETDVCDTFLDSSWYFLRYPSSEFDQVPFDKERTKKWLPVSQYIGGAEHTVLHLLYSRFVTMALYDMGYFDFSDKSKTPDEPFPNFFAHGLIIKEGAKMSKSRGNIVVPDQYIQKYGADALRCYLMFLGPFEAGGDFRDTGMQGMFKFLKRIWRLFNSDKSKGSQTSSDLKIKLAKTIKKVTDDISRFKYNTALASMMELVNSWEEEGKTFSKSDALIFLKLLAPFAPHLTEEIYQISKEKKEEKFESIHKQSWPSYDPKLLIAEKIQIAVQINGKLRTQVNIPQEFINDRDYIIKAVLKEKKIKKYIQQRIQAKKIFYVPAKLINFVLQ